MFRILASTLAGLALSLSLVTSGTARSSSRALASSAGPNATSRHGSGAGAINPEEFVSGVNNPWFPLTPGTTLRYKGEKDGKPAIDVFEVTHRTKTIQGVTTTVIHDQLLLGGKLEEVTTDWYAQDRKGNVWYFGEATKTLDAHGRVTSTEGSWEAGVRGARPGVFVPGDSHVGQTGQQEFFKGEAEDHFTVLSLNASVRVPYVSSDRALKTKEFTPLEPKVLDNKYYVLGIGTVLEVAIKGPVERLELISVKTR
jgi:hypothetical protein